ncbi:uncharacterized protein LOC111412410 [Olea europaea var. sylvestris]|uniref:uncharacterized protein LOC111412410 n=1 Tax=Olea europaea var. sylvestris TaxID=158386 RepID=UPI000C1D1804|nr:uncharacterized protein LOC111412410 [Olea europaea var. sylvestris]
MKFEVLLNSVLPSGLNPRWECRIRHECKYVQFYGCEINKFLHLLQVFCLSHFFTCSFLTSQKNFGQWDLMDQEDQGVAGVVDLWYRVFSWSRWVHWWVFQLNTLGDFFLLILSLPLLVATRLFWRASTFSHSSLPMEIQIHFLHLQLCNKSVYFNQQKNLTRVLISILHCMASFCHFCILDSFSIHSIRETRNE